MKLWFQIVVAIGLLSVSAASLTYTWRAWRAYQLEKQAEEVCTPYIEEKGKDFGSVERWLTRRQCINGVLGKTEVSTQ